MPIQDKTTIIDDLMVYGKVSIGNKQLAEANEEQAINVSNMNTDTNYQGKLTKVFGADGLSLNSNDNINIHSELGDVNIEGEIIRLECDRFKLPNSRAIYGTADPNDLGLHDVEEGTLYFKLVND